MALTDGLDEGRDKTPPPFNICNSIPLPALSVPHTPLRRSTHDATVANEALAAVLAHVKHTISQRLRSCGPYFRCRLWKYCAHCGPAREARLVRDYSARLSRVASPAHLTLSTRSCYTLSPETLPSLASAFNQLRTQQRFVHSVSGGVVNYQVKHGEHGWLPHAHVLLDYRGGLSQTWIKRTWTALTGAWEVSFTSVMPGTQTKVLAYGARRQGLPHDRWVLQQFYDATRRFRSIQPWGTLHPLHGRPRSGSGRSALPDQHHD